MHDLTLPQWAIDRGKERRGKLHIYDDLDPRKTALIVVDLQNGFMVPEHTPKPVATAIEIVPMVNRLAAELRETGGKVFWIKNTIDETNLKEWSNWFAQSKPDMVQQRIETFRVGAPGHDVYLDQRAARGRDRAQIPLQRLRPGLVRFAGAAQGARHGYGPHRRHRHECLLRVVRARRHDAELQDDHGERLQLGL
jgi:hypothetical protein